MGQIRLITPEQASISNAQHDMRRAHYGMLLWALIVGTSFPVVGMMSEGLPLYAVMGLSLAGFFGTMFWAAHRTSALSMATLYVSAPLLAYYLGRLFGVEQRAVQLLGIPMLGAVGALGLAMAETGGQLGELQFGVAEAAFFVGCVGSALYPVLSKFGLNSGWLSRRAEVRTFWSLLTGSVLVGLLGLIVEIPQHLATTTLLDASVLIYLGVFSSGMTFWLTQRATAVLTPAAVTAYSYLVPFVSMLLLKRDAAKRRPKQHTQSLQLRPAGQVAECFFSA
jgi:drug/metabolite transporter (DMT)-like permease